MAKTLHELATALGAELVGDGDILVERIASLEGAEPGDLSFLSNPRFRTQLAQTRAGAVILRASDAEFAPTAALLLADPYLGYAKAAQLLEQRLKPAPGVHPSAIVDDTAEVDASASVGAHCVVGAGAVVGAGCELGPGCVIEAHARIGADTRLVANVTIRHAVTLGERVLIYPGAVIGGDGFGFAPDHGHWVKIPQTGAVRIGNDVEIGANTTIDRGALEDTVIGDGVKIDNLVHVAHNVQVGAHTAMAACVGIAGSTHIGSHCTLGGQVGVVGHLKVADNVHVTGGSTIFQSIDEPGLYSSGLPLTANRAWRRNYHRLAQLDEMAKQLKRLEKQLAQLTKQDNHE